ncbi:MAG TPA: radical SAM protein [Thermoanaerobaculia bacterium]|nr:radical SAM protein [Thermoanaerobaculia bacterium]
MGELNAQVSETATVFGRDPEWVLSFDREGRLLTFVQGRELFKRALDSRLFQRDRREGRRWKLLDDRGRREVFAAARELAGATAGAPDAPAALRERLETEVLPWTVERLLAEEERFLAAYRPIAILPPDRYLAVVLQATEGCTWNRCTFCSFYQGRPFHLASPEDFRRHAAAVQSLLGRDLARRRSIFLADGNALAVGNRRLLPLLAVARESFPGREITGFVDVYSGSRHEPTDWRELAAQGLTQVYIGMETGCDGLLAWVDKPGSRAELTAFVRELKEAGLAVSLILMIGMGGRAWRERHRRESLETLAGLSLDRRDLLYLSPFVEEAGSAYVSRRLAEGWEPLSADEIEAETALWTADLRARGLRLGRYDIREFIY